MNKSLILVAQELHISTNQVQTVLDLLEAGSTVPFIARYRQTHTGGLDEEQIEQISKQYRYSVELNQRKETISKILQEKGLLTPELEKAIAQTQIKSELENIYEPFKIGKKTKATEAIALGLEPLAKTIYEETNPHFNPFREASEYISEKVPTVEFAIEQAQLIIAQWMSQDVEARKTAKNQILKYGLITSKKTEVEDPKSKFQNYYQFRCPISKIYDYQILALNRAENLKIITVKLEFNEKKIIYDLNNHFFRVKTTGKIILESLKDSLDRLILPSISREIRSDLFERAEEKSIVRFSENLEQILLLPAIKDKTVLAVDPAFASGCKIAILSKTGDLVSVSLIRPNEPFKEIAKSEKIMLDLIKKHNVDHIVIGNGTASRETEKFVSSSLKRNDLGIPVSITSEVGASVYSASPVAIKEFPDLSVEQRSAINIGRRFQDPLNELVKIDPKSIGVGQYQHDLNQGKLTDSLDFKVKKVVNQVGVDINTATPSILGYVAGINKSTAENIITHRQENGIFKSRQELLNVKGLGAKSYEQSIGFLRINNSDNFYDKTNIHPESYALADQIVNYLGLDLSNINIELIKNADAQKLVTDLGSNLYDVQLILDSLLNPGKDIRENNVVLDFKADILSIQDLSVGLQLQGQIQNITDFGVFVYIGLKNAALIPNSKLYVDGTNYNQTLKNGDIITLEIINVEIERERIQAKLVKIHLS